MDGESVVFTCRIKVNGTRRADEAMRALQIMLDDYEDNNSGSDDYCGIEIHDIRKIKE